MATFNSYRFVLMAFIFGSAIQAGNFRYLLVHLGDDAGAKVDNGKSILP